MKLDDGQVMAFPRKMVEQIVLGLTNPLNRHLVKLVGFDFPKELRSHLKREVETWLVEIQSMRLKPNNHAGSFKFYFDLLFDYPFGGVEQQNMIRLMGLIQREYEHAHPPGHQKRWSNGCGGFIPDWPSVCTTVRMCSI